MSTAERLIARGKAEGKAEGVWIGKVQLQEEMLGVEQSAEGSLATLSLEDLKTRFQELQKLYQAKFKTES